MYTISEENSGQTYCLSVLFEHFSRVVIGVEQRLLFIWSQIAAACQAANQKKERK